MPYEFKALNSEPETQKYYGKYVPFKMTFLFDLFSFIIDSWSCMWLENTVKCRFFDWGKAKTTWIL